MSFFKRKSSEDRKELDVKLIKTNEAFETATKNARDGHWYAISLYPIWAWLVVNGYKDIENRRWATLWRGRTLIHANNSMLPKEYQEAFKFACSIDSKFAQLLPSFADCQKMAGHVIGSVNIAEVLPKPSADYFTSPWHMEGNYGLKLASARAYKSPVACRGNVGIFKVDEVLNPIFKQLEA